MATTFTYSGFAYGGKVAQQWYSNLLLEAKSVELLQIMPNVKHKMNLPTMNVGQVLKADSCDFSPAGSITISSRAITVETLGIQMELCANEIEPLWIGENLRAGQANGGEVLPATEEEFLLNLVVEKVAQEIETIIWQGNTSTGSGVLGLVDGLEALFAADGTVIDVTATTLTVGNIMTEMGKVKNAMPQTLLSRLNKEKVFLVMNPVDRQLYVDALGLTFSSPALVTDEAGYRFGSLKIFEADGITQGHMVAADFSRIFMGTDLLDDMLEIKAISMYDTLGEKKMRIVGGVRLGFQYISGAEIVYYH